MGDCVAGKTGAELDAALHDGRRHNWRQARQCGRNRRRSPRRAHLRTRGYSMAKSVVSLLVGIAIDRGLIKDLDAPAVSYFPEDTDLRMPDKDPITLRHLLTMSAGLGSGRAPGVSFVYSNNETELVGAILKKVTGKTVDVLAEENIFAPLGI